MQKIQQQQEKYYKNSVQLAMCIFNANTGVCYVCVYVWECVQGRPFRCAEKCTWNFSIESDQIKLHSYICRIILNDDYDDDDDAAAAAQAIYKHERKKKE